MIGDSYDTILMILGGKQTLFTSQRTHQTPHPGHVNLVYCIAEKKLSTFTECKTSLCKMPDFSWYLTGIMHNPGSNTVL